MRAISVARALLGVALAAQTPAAHAQRTSAPAAPLLSQQIGGARLQFIDISLDALVAAGSSSASDAELEALQGGEHDPRQAGFTLQQVELGLQGAVDPYLRGEAYLIYFVDPGGESRFEVEEAFASSMMLPLGLEGLGFQIEAGQIFTEFGRQNPTHPHGWDWQDQPLVLTRFFGGDGIRAPGFRIGWLTPLPWFSELHFGMQNAKGETMVSFLANDEVFALRPIGGRPFAGRGVNDGSDFTYLGRWVNGFDLGETLSAQLGASVLFGGNATGSGARTHVAGGDLVVKWRPLETERGWPFATLQGEFLYRDYEAAGGSFCDPAADPSACTPAFLAGDVLRDWGFYAQALWGFRRGWAAGLRGELAGGRGAGVAFDSMAVAWVPVPRNADAFRANRARISPLLAFHPSEFARLRLQYNFDRAEHLRDRSQHSVWIGLEFLFGAHPAHAY